MMGTSDDQADLQVKGQALVTFRSGCDAVLQLKQASITGLDEKVSSFAIFTFVLALQASVVKFQHNDR